MIVFSEQWDSYLLNKAEQFIIDVTCTLALLYGPLVHPQSKLCCLENKFSVLNLANFELTAKLAIPVHFSPRALHNNSKLRVNDQKPVFRKSGNFKIWSILLHQTSNRDCNISRSIVSIISTSRFPLIKKYQLAVIKILKLGRIFYSDPQM